MRNTYRERQDSGQVLILTAMLVIVILGMVGLVIDGGFLYAQRRQSQNAADEAAIAAALELTYGGSSAQAAIAGLENAASNGFDNNGTSNTVTVNNPPTTGEHIGDPNYVEVIVTEDPTTFFIHVITSSAGVSGRGVAGLTTSSGDGYAIFVANTDCAILDALVISGNVITVDGAVHSNSNGKVSGNVNAFNEGYSYSTAPGCQQDDSGSNNSYTPPVAQADPLSFPLNDTYASICAQPGATVYSGAVDLTGIFGSTIPDGIYCTDGEMSISGSNVTGNITVAALGELSLSGSNFNLNAYYNDILAFTESSTGDTDLDVSGSGGSFNGILVAPNGQVAMQGSANLSISGSILADTIQISGSAFSLTAIDYGFGGPGLVALVE